MCGILLGSETLILRAKYRQKVSVNKVLMRKTLDLEGIK
jgi:hypothetical protein